MGFQIVFPGAGQTGNTAFQLADFRLRVIEGIEPDNVVHPGQRTVAELRLEGREAATERRRELTENGQVLNRVVYDSMVFVPASTDRVPGGGLLFESRFESGNLRRAVQVSEYEYDLILRPDANTRGHTQWFYFGVAKMKHGTPTAQFGAIRCAIL